MDRTTRDLDGYGPTPPDPDWPGGTIVAVQVAMLYTEGTESSLADAGYGARAGFWRLHRVLTAAKIPVTVFADPTALARSPRQMDAMQAAGWEIACQGQAWPDPASVTEATERAQMRETVSLHKQLTGTAPKGWIAGTQTPNTMRVAAEMGGFDYLGDATDDDLPYWRRFGDGAQLILPWTPATLDSGPHDTPQLMAHMRDWLDTLRDEGRAGHPKMMTLGMDPAHMGQPARIKALMGFLAHAQASDDVWFATRADIATHWRQTHPWVAQSDRPSTLSGKDFVDRFGAVFAHSPWIAEQAWEGELGPAHDTPLGLFSALARRFRAASHDQKLSVLCAQPVQIQAAATPALDKLPQDLAQRLSALCTAYKDHHRFPFIPTQQCKDAAHILKTVDACLTAPTDVEFARACAAVEGIARANVDALFATTSASDPP